ncbi:SDR family NAD(P)-dependent oxidoreductase [Oceanobacter mangrovi]|uniref:SDR family NAD(P)-dependent oxidoreductase n=1 Tax=Oceanobacter mangrovi TaxID=2862510 RepID=UPI001C8D010B|nr:SDR family NAD(P)-dependent oxidoreductase [Oceanobacter mangrovi]
MTASIQRLFDLSGQTALVTGSSRGIGKSIAVALAQAGARVVISSESAADCEAVVAELRARQLDVFALAADMSQRPQVQRLTEQLIEQFGGVDILVCNAGVSIHNGPMHLASEQDWDTTMNINLRSAHWLCAALIPLMAQRQRGSVVLMSSLSALRGNRSIGLYSLTKAALSQLARNLAIEWGPDNVRINAIAPGLIDTDLAQVFHDNPELKQRRLAMTPLRRLGHVDEIAATTLYLASAAGGFVTGQTLVVDGGTLITDGS